MASATMMTDSDNPHLYYDHGLMAVVDSSPSTSAAGTPASAHKALSSLFASLISTLPVTMNADHGPILSLPLPSTPLPRAKPLAKPKPLTKWQQFARKKGIAENKKKEGKLVYDEDTKEWVPRWGFKGANKKVQEQWIHEVPANKDDDYDPSKAMKAERKKRRLHNEGQRLRNESRNTAAAAAAASSSSSSSLPTTGTSLDTKAYERSKRKAELEASAMRNRASTASMGKFDSYLAGESSRAPKGTRRTFDPNEGDARAERKKQMAILGKLDGSSSHKPRGSEGVLNERKAVRFASRGEGALSLARKNGARSAGARGDAGKRKRS
ncbi:unnamed protein product [Parajaminaea phylloscopi]